MPRRRKFDCVTCGACCCNINVNRRRKLYDYVQIEPRDKILRKRTLVRLLVFRDAEGTPHMKLDAEQKCVALGGVVGQSVACNIYLDRPGACRRVQPGDAECRSARRERGIDRPPRARA